MYITRIISGKKEKILPKGKLQKREGKKSAISATYEEYQDAETQLEYLKLIG